MVVPVGQVQAAQGPAVLHAEATDASGSTEVGEAGSGMDSRGKFFKQISIYKILSTFL